MLDKIQIALLFSYLGICVFHLICCFFQLEKLRKITKPFCLTPLIGFTIYSFTTHPAIYIGLGFALLGDIFLIFVDNKKCFVFGTLFFLASHICFFIECTRLLSYRLPPWFYVLIISIIVLLTIGLFPISKNIAGRIAICGNSYGLFLILMIIMGILLTVDNPHIYPGLLVIFGYVLFIISDSILTVSTFIIDFKRKDFYIMATYLSAVFLIITGLSMVVLL